MVAVCLVAFVVAPVAEAEPGNGNGGSPRACNDGRDNDGDGRLDYPDDPGCTSKGDDDEYNDWAACEDGTDNDQDGYIDYPSDPGCESASDADEFNPSPPPAPIFRYLHENLTASPIRPTDDSTAMTMFAQSQSIPRWTFTETFAYSGEPIHVEVWAHMKGAPRDLYVNVNEASGPFGVGFGIYYVPGTGTPLPDGSMLDAKFSGTATFNTEYVWQMAKITIWDHDQAGFMLHDSAARPACVAVHATNC